MNILLEAFAKSFELVFTLNEDLFEILLLSLKVSGISLLLSCLIGLPLGTFLAIKSFWGKDAFLVLFNTMMGLPPVVVGLIVAILASVLAGDYIRSSFMDLEKAAADISAGSYRKKDLESLPIKRSDEIGSMARNISTISSLG